MNKYELTVVVSANVEDEGVISNVEDCGKKRLAYEIQHMKDGFYYFIKFDADAAAPAEIESRIRIMDNVIRFLIVKEEA